ncbi:MAG: outer membrane lipoprotein chaperone LolA [Gammaproteobacteria bacterium]|nr:MAG: outer membrane lipoprotein chaperone LolA [Gammaproteobacteria bacterium]
MTLSAARKNLFPGILLILGMVRASSAQGESEGQRLIDDFINNVHTMSGRFEQQLVDADGIVIDKSSGTIEFQKPGRFRWTYLEPYEQILVADGLNIWSYDVDLEQVTVKAQAKVLASTPALLLGGAQDVLDDFEYIGSFAERDIVWVRLRPKTTDNGFTKVELGFKEGKLSRMIFGDNLGQTTLIALFDLTVNESIDEQRFSFTPPDGVDVVGRPLSPAPADL